MPDVAPATTQRWVSAYLSVFAQSVYDREADDVIRGLVRTIVTEGRDAGCIESHFFVRYTEVTPHIRIRLKPAPNVGAEPVRDLILEQVRRVYPDSTVGKQRTRTWPPATGIGSVFDVSWVDYEPEEQRYGGREGVVVAERFFEDSSESTFRLLDGLGESRSSRLGRALGQMIVLCHAFAPRKADALRLTTYFLRSYLVSLARRSGIAEGSWRSMFEGAFHRQAAALVNNVTDAWSVLAVGGSPGEALGLLVTTSRRRAQELRTLHDEGLLAVYGRRCDTWDEAVLSLAPSYLHMMSNRNGITLTEEAYLADLIRRSMLAEHTGRDSHSNVESHALADE
jgi:thiopeptide-type bacteriocin biosynthesis protein